MTRAVLVIVGLLFSFLIGLPAFCGEPTVVGQSAILLDARNGQVLYNKDAHRKMFPASTTKMLTAIIALEKGDLSDKVVIPREAALQDGSSIGLQEGEMVSLKDLVYALLLTSSNDAAVAIAYHISGSVPGFADLMNKKAREIGALSSNFVNPNGLPDPSHYSTAYDLAQIARYAMGNTDFRKIVDARFKLISRPYADRSKGPPQEHLYNHNKLLKKYPGANGVKTGYTTKAGHCLVGAAGRNGRELIAAVLCSDGASIYNDVSVLLDYGFNTFSPQLIIKRGEHLSTMGVRYGEKRVQILSASDFYYNLPVGFEGNIEKEFRLKKVKAPLADGQKIGELVLSDNELELGRVDLIAGGPVKRKLIYYWWFWFGLAVGILLARKIICSVLKTGRKSRVRRVNSGSYLKLKSR